MTFGERLLLYINRSGMSQKELAEKVGITPTRLNYWVKDKREPDVFHIKSLAKSLGVTGDQLLGIDEPVCSDSAMKVAVAYDSLNEAGKQLIDQMMEFAKQHHSL